ncbi:hypothetical protein GGX14DRAFT_361066 [Mycena pura]|uniref:Glutaredoxin domain-containing protein n=1 Tax=Mycena pura TaxID=153505 RepID=A0AAD6VHE9_9AGAR|nr:hypothetical protein GGX14DRAFT_361066 [Mycena pura]
MEPKKRTTGSSFAPIRRRRFFVCILALVAFIYFFGSPFKLPAALKDVPGLSRANIAQLVKYKAQPPAKVHEIFGLLSLVTGDSENEHILAREEGFDPTRPVDMAVYAAGKDDIDWNTRVQELNERFPVVVFSKVRHTRHSKRAKALLETYKLSPPPKIIEVDLRGACGSPSIKHLLTRLTDHATFPNVILRGKSLGGSDTLHALHSDKSLRRMLEGAGMVIRADI